MAAQYVLIPGSGYYHRVDDDTGPYVQTSPGVYALAGSGSGGGGGGGAVTVADGADVAEGATTDAAAAAGGTGSVSAKLRRISAQLPAALGSVAAASSLATTASTEDVARTGIITETAPATDTASSGLNGRLQRIAQRLSSLLALFTATAFSDANRLPTQQKDSLAVSGSATSAAVLFTQDMTGFNSISVQTTSAGAGCTITYEGSDDNVNWNSAFGVSIVNGGSTGNTSNAVGAMTFQRRSMYFRARVSTYGSGTVSVVGTASQSSGASAITVSAVSINGTSTVQGTTAHGNAIGGNPTFIAGRARTSNYAAVANDQVADYVSTLVGALINKPYSIPEADWSYAAAPGGISNTTVAVTIAAAAGAGIRNYLTGLQLSSDALGAATELAIRDGAGGTVLWRTKIGTGGLAAGEAVTFPSPLKSTANTLLEVVTLTASVTGGVFVNAQGYTAP
jgi:hypothetical protein